jgi:hypothetical protein
MPLLHNNEEWLPSREFQQIETEFSLDEGREPRRSGYRPIWRFPQESDEPVMVGMSEMALMGEADAIQPGTTALASFIFYKGVQGYIEHLVKPGDVIEICDGTSRVGTVRILRFVY